MQDVVPSNISTVSTLLTRGMCVLLLLVKLLSIWIVTTLVGKEVTYEWVILPVVMLIEIVVFNYIVTKVYRNWSHTNHVERWKHACNFVKRPCVQFLVIGIDYGM